MKIKDIFNSLLDNYYQIAWKVYDKLYIFTGSEKFFCFDEQAVYNEEVVRGSPVGCNLPFNFIIPYGQQIGNEYFVVCDLPADLIAQKLQKSAFTVMNMCQTKSILAKRNGYFRRKKKSG